MPPTAAQGNCTVPGTFVVQVTGTCAACSPNEIHMPYSTFAANLAPPANQPVFVQYRHVSTFLPSNLHHLRLHQHEHADTCNSWCWFAEQADIYTVGHPQWQM